MGPQKDAGYNALYAAGATHVICWAHARRGFFETKECVPARAHEALARIRVLYAVEAARATASNVIAHTAAP